MIIWIMGCIYIFRYIFSLFLPYVLFCCLKIRRKLLLLLQNGWKASLCYNDLTMFNRYATNNGLFTLLNYYLTGSDHYMQYILYYSFRLYFKLQMHHTHRHSKASLLSSNIFICFLCTSWTCCVRWHACIHTFDLNLCYFTFIFML